MPPRPPLANTAKVEIAWSGPDSAKATNIMYVMIPSGGAVSAALSSIANQIANALTTGTNHLMNYINEHWTLTQVTAIDNSGVTEDFVTVPVGLTGVLGGIALTPSVCVCLSWQISARYRGGKPRTYLSGIDSNALDTAGGRMISSGYQTNFELAGNYLIAQVEALTIDGGPCALGTISYRTGNAERPTPLFRVYSSCNVNPRLDSQRRRLGKEVTAL